MITLWQLNRWPRRLAFLAGNLAVALVIAFACILPVRDFFADRDQQIVEQRMMLSRFKAVADQEATVHAASRQTAADHAEFLVGRNEGVISADLQTRLKGIAEASGAKLRSVRSLPAKSDEQLKYVGSRIELFASLAAIHRAIHAIENAKPYLFVKGAVIRLSPPIGQTGVLQEPIIEAQLDVFGAVHIEAAEK